MKSIKLIVLAVTTAFLLLIGCGGGGESTSKEQDSSDTKTVSAVPAGTATISGTINFAGTAPKMKRINHDAECKAFHTEPVFSQNVVVNDNNTIKYVFIYVLRNKCCCLANKSLQIAVATLGRVVFELLFYAELACFAIFSDFFATT